MAFDGITTKIIVNELSNKLINSRVEKIYVPTRNEIWISLHTKSRDSVKLLISIDANNCRFHLSNESRNNPEKAPQFCMILRKYLSGAKILNIEQVGLDRIVRFTFETIDDFGDIVQKILVVELMGKYSNIILIDDKNKIIDSIRHVDITMSSVREVLPSRTYISPSSLGKLNFTEITTDEFITVLRKSIDESEFDNISISNVICNNFVGFSKSLINALCEYLKLDLEIAKEHISDEMLITIYKELSFIFANVSNVVFTFNDSKKDYIIDFDKLHNDSKAIDNSIFIDEFYSQKENASLLKSAKQNLEHEVNAHISKINKKLQLVNKTLEDEPNLEKYRQYGDLLSSNIYRMEIGMESVEVENFYDNNTLVKIPLQKNLTPSRNAQQYFKKYNKLKGSILHSKEHKKEYADELEYLNSVLFEINEVTSIFELDDIREELVNSGYTKKSNKKGKKKDLPSEPLEYEFNGVKILVGRNNIQNDRLSLKTARKNHMWLHTKKIHGSHVIIVSEEVDDALLYYAATLAKKHSNAKNSSKVEVDYTLAKFVHKESGAKPGMVVYTDYKTIIVE